MVERQAEWEMALCLRLTSHCKALRKEVVFLRKLINSSGRRCCQRIWSGEGQEPRSRWEWDRIWLSGTLVGGGCELLQRREERCFVWLGIEMSGLTEGRVRGRPTHRNRNIARGRLQGSFKGEGTHRDWWIDLLWWNSGDSSLCWWSDKIAWGVVC